FLIVGTTGGAPRSCSNSASRWSDVPAELTQLLSPLHDWQFKSRREFGRQVRNASTSSSPIHLGMNPPACPIAVKPQAFLDLAPVGLDGGRSQSPYCACGFVVVKELHALHSAAQELLGQFARPNGPIPLKHQQDRPLKSRQCPRIIKLFLLENHKLRRTS